MKLRYFKALLKKVEMYNKKASNPFLKTKFNDNSTNTIYEKTYIWITKENNKN